MKRIAFFLMDLSGGGAERVILNLARGFADSGFDTDLVLVQATGSYLSQLPPNINTVVLNSRRLITSLPALIHYLKTNRPDILISALEDTNLVALWAIKLARISIFSIVTVHNNLSSEARHLRSLKRRLTPYLVRLFYPWAHKIIAVSDGVAQDLKTLGLPQEKIQFIYNPIITPEIQDQLQESLDHPWFLDEKVPVILGVGRLSKQKNFSTLIHAVAQVKEHHPARLMILGEGEERETLEALAQSLNIAQDVCFINFVSNPYIYMAQAKMLVLSSAWEGFGNVLVEAMAAGTPVISTDCKSGPAEILDQGKYGKLVDVGAIEDMAKAIIETLANPLPADILKTRANYFTLERSLAEYQALWETFELSSQATESHL